MGQDQLRTLDDNTSHAMYVMNYYMSFHFCESQIYTAFLYFTPDTELEPSREIENGPSWEIVS